MIAEVSTPEFVGGQRMTVVKLRPSRRPAIYKYSVKILCRRLKRDSTELLISNREIRSRRYSQVLE